MYYLSGQLSCVYCVLPNFSIISKYLASLLITASNHSLISLIVHFSFSINSTPASVFLAIQITPLAKSFIVLLIVVFVLVVVASLLQVVYQMKPLLVQSFL